jgi:hypothetical protein
MDITLRLLEQPALKVVKHYSIYISADFSQFRLVRLFLHGNVIEDRGMETWHGLNRVVRKAWQFVCEKK